MENRNRYLTVGLSICVIFLSFLMGSIVSAQPQAPQNEAQSTPITPPATINFTSTAVSATGTRAADELLATQLFQTSPVQPMMTMSHDDSVENVYFWVAGARHISWDTSGTIKLWDAISGELLLTLSHGYPMQDNNLGVPLKSVQINTDDTRLLAWSNATSECMCDLTANIWDINPESAFYGQLLVTVSQDDPNDVLPGGGAMWSPDETLLVTWSRDGSVKLWDAVSGEALATLRHDSVVWGVAWSRDSARLITWSSDRNAMVWDIDSALSDSSVEPVFQLQHRRPPVWGAMWSPDERMILTWSLESGGSLWDASNGNLIATLPHDGRVWSAIWEDNRIITSGFDSAVRVWNVRDAFRVDMGQDVEPALVVRQNGNAFTRTFLNPNGRIAVSIGINGLIVWSLETGGIYYALPVRATSAEWYPTDGRNLLTVSDNGVAEIWGGTSGERIATLVQDGFIRGASWSGDGVPDPQPQTWNENGQVTVWGGRLASSQVISPPPTAITPTPTQTSTPTPTPTPSNTPTPIPSPAVATLEAAWYQSDIFADHNPRTSWLLQVPVGGSLDLLFGYEICCYMMEEEEWEDLTWSVAPSDRATIDSNGVLTVGENIEATSLTVTASIANGLSKSVVVNVYDPASNPLVGVWMEDSSIDCQSGEFVAPTNRIWEFILTTDGQMSVSWSGFEVLVDYIGSYAFDLESGDLLLQGRYLNYFPSDFDGAGRFSIDEEGALILHDIWLGTAPYSEQSLACGHRFVQR